MSPVPINYLAVIVAAAASMIIGMIWYGPLFGKTWRSLMGFTPLPSRHSSSHVEEKIGGEHEESQLPKQMVAGFSDESTKAMTMTPAKAMIGGGIAALVMAFVLAHALIFAATYLKVNGVKAGLQAGFWNWLGFAAPLTLGAVLWDGKPWRLWFLNAGYWLVALLAMALILALWP